MELRVPARVESLAVVRAMTGCLADYEELSGDTAGDLALAVDEACTVLIGMSSPGANLVLVEDPGVDVLSVRVSTACDSVHGEPGSAGLSGFSRRVLDSLAEQVDTFADEFDYAHTGEPRPVLGISLTVRRNGFSVRR
ncbi:anti-sigma factor [Mycolicibacterium setense]